MFKENRSYVSIYRGHKDFMFCPDGISLVPRAMLHVTPECPHHIAEAISIASKNGWLQSVANLRDTEYTMELLKK